VDGTLSDIRFAVEYGGCCGYEGADVLALRLHRPHFGGGCIPTPREWADDWAMVTDAGLYARARVRGNRVEVRWEREASLTEVVAYTDGLLGQRLATVKRAAGDRWHAIDADRYLVEVPHLFESYGRGSSTPMAERTDLGLVVTVRAGKIVEVAARMSRFEEIPDGLETALRARLGRPNRAADDTLSWHKRGRTVVSDLSGWTASLTLGT
jgi:hypothetical protein